MFPLLSEQISNIFSLESTEVESPIIIKSSSKSQRKYDDVQQIDLRSLQSAVGLKMTNEIKPIEKLFNYQKKIDSSDKENIKISLPTYKPEMTSEKIFIPIERIP